MRRWTWRVLKWGIATAVAVGVVFYVHSVWSASDELRQRLLDPASSLDAEYDIEVLDLTGDRLTLARAAASQADGVYGVRWQGGYGRMGHIREITQSSVTRDFEVFDGELGVGEFVLLDEYALPADTQTALGIEPSTVAITGPDGDYPAWLFPASGSTWVIFVHGRGVQDRAQVHRILPTLLDLDLPVLAITYRNDPGAPPDPDGRVYWGLREWVELEAAAKYVLANGAEDYVVMGYGLGGAVASVFARESVLASAAAGFVLDSPILDLSVVADQDAALRGVSEVVAEPAKALASFRFSMKWADLDQANHADEFRAPILLLHGTANALSPVGSADEFAASRPDLIVYERFEGAGHMAVWNWDPLRYEKAVSDFIATLADVDAAATG